MKLGICIVSTCVLAATLFAADVPVLVKRTGQVRSESISIPALEAHSAYSLHLAVDPLTAFGENSRVAVTLAQGGGQLVHKTLHLGDADLYAMFHAPASGPAKLSLSVEGPLATAASYHLEVHRWGSAKGLQSGPSHRWEDATPVALGATTFAVSDEAPYIPLPGTTEAAVLEDPAAEHWYRFAFDGAAPKLVFFQLDLMERDNLPVDVAVFRKSGAGVVAFDEGADPVTPPHEVQALAGNKFTTRILKQAGDYYIRVRARHPEYKLRTRVYDPPPYKDPKIAVQTAIDFIIGAGDSWHANTPRRGGIYDRVANVHQETSLCVACHPTHFSQRAQLYAATKGYAIHQRQQLQFLAERFYNNPRPFYGFEQQGAVWARVISSAANVLSRMSVLLDMLETGVTGERRDAYHRGVAEYLKLYYKGRTDVPPDETNGNTPLVSTYEVAWYSWRVTHDPAIAAMIPQEKAKNLVDLCYQTLALADIDPKKHAAQIKANADRILALQRPDGQWAMRFEPDQPEAEFQTGHALWALYAAGIPREHPQVAKGLAYLLSRQQPFGGWMDPLQSYENFRTPFRETQMSIIALSSYYPAGPAVKGWQSTVQQLPQDPAELIAALDQVWDRPSDAVLSGIVAATKSNDAMVRQAAVEALGRLAPVTALPAMVARLGDASKIVARTAAWAVRQVYSRHPEAAGDALVAALNAKDERTRWGATRVFATHFAALAKRREFAAALLARVDDPAIPVRMQALKGLWQFWFWSPDATVQGRIEDAFLAAMDRPQHPWIARNLREGIYNIADENIRYYYNNWIPLLASKADGERSIRGRLAVEDRLATKFANVLEHGSDRQKKMLLAGLADFHLRHADVYDVAKLEKPAAPGAPVYNRIGNDVEQVVFFGAANERISAAILPLMDSPDRELAKLAAEGALLARPVTFPGVNQVAGPAGAKHDALAARLKSDPALAQIARTFQPPPPPRRAQTAKTVEKRQPLDHEFFQAKVRPILEKKGKDGYACVQCHATHTIFNGSYETALKVIDRQNPENSLILRKPISGSETEGILGSTTLPHGGGVRWEKNSPEYSAILEWIQGAGQ